MKTTIKLLVMCSAIGLSPLVQASTDAAIASAEEARKAAAAVGYEWRDTAKMIKKAQKLAAEGKTEEARKLARQAEQQSKNALAQYHSESKRYSSLH